MQTHRYRPLNLTVGEFVEVLSVPEILDTLDEGARLEAMPFMPEMLKFAGRRFRVAKQVSKTCDRVTKSGLRILRDSVLLEGIRCDGEFHGGCEAGCTLLWKEAWLRRVDDDRPSAPREASDGRFPLSAEHGVFKATRAEASSDPSADPVYSCQATDVLKFTTPPEKHVNNFKNVKNLFHYWHDVRCGNARFGTVLRVMAISAFNHVQRRRGGVTYPPVSGALTNTPTCSLDLEPGDLVRVKSREEIVATLDVGERNRGLSFDKEMVPFCGGTYRVLRRVKKIIDEPTGKLIDMKRDCIILDEAACQGWYHELCPRGLYPFWREIWLTRATGPVSMGEPSGQGSFVLFALTQTTRAALTRLARIFGLKDLTRAVPPAR